MLGLGAEVYDFGFQSAISEVEIQGEFVHD